MIVDTHTHVMSFPSLEAVAPTAIRSVSDLASFRARYPHVAAAASTESAVSNVDQLLCDMDRNGITLALVQARPGNISNWEVAAAIENHKDRLMGLARIGANYMVSGYPDDPGIERTRLANEIRVAIEELGFVGVGEIFVRSLTRKTNAEAIADDLDEIMSVIAAAKVPVQFPSGWSQFRGGLGYGDPLWIDEVAARYPSVPIIVTKMGRGIQHLFDNALMVAIRNPNVYFDLVGTTASHVQAALTAIGPTRLLFGTDWSATWRHVVEPQHVYEKQLALVDQLGLSQEAKDLIIAQNAVDLFRLDTDLGSRSRRVAK